MTMNTDPEAIARRIVEFNARYQATRSLPLGSSERRDAFLSAMQSSIDDAPTLAAAYLDLRAEIARLRAEVERLTAQRNELREAARQVTAYGCTVAAVRQLSAALEAAR